ncbi:MAG: hypothetical protein R3B07_37665, partial [Polyangiaceae bacterium]
MSPTKRTHSQLELTEISPDIAANMPPMRTRMDALDPEAGIQSIRAIGSRVKGTCGAKLTLHASQMGSRSEWSHPSLFSMLTTRVGLLA